MLSFVQSLITFEYDLIFKAIANKSGRMQYFKIIKGKKQKRISQGEFLNAYNNLRIIAIKPIQNDSIITPIQMEIYIKND